MTSSKPPHPHPPGPTALLGTPSHAMTPRTAAPARVVAVPRSVPTLTVYAEGYVQPNATGAALLSAHAEGCCFLPPASVRPGRTPRLWEVRAGECHLFVGHSEKIGQLRFRAAGDCPPPGRYLLLPVAGKPDCFSLLPG